MHTIPNRDDLKNARDAAKANGFPAIRPVFYYEVEVTYEQWCEIRHQLTMLDDRTWFIEFSFDEVGLPDHWYFLLTELLDYQQVEEVRVVLEPNALEKAAADIRAERGE